MEVVSVRESPGELGLTGDQLLDMLYKMMLARAIGQRVRMLNRMGKVPFAVTGEGEITLPELVRKMAAGERVYGIYQGQPVENLDILDGTPLLDIKPYVPEFDSPTEINLGWLETVKGKARSMRSDKRFKG